MFPSVSTAPSKLLKILFVNISCSASSIIGTNAYSYSVLRPSAYQSMCTQLFSSFSHSFRVSSFTGVGRCLVARVIQL